MNSVAIISVCMSLLAIVAGGCDCSTKRVPLITVRHIAEREIGFNAEPEKPISPASLASILKQKATDEGGLVSYGNHPTHSLDIEFFQDGNSTQYQAASSIAFVTILGSTRVESVKFVLLADTSASQKSGLEFFEFIKHSLAISENDRVFTSSSTRNRPSE